MLLIELRDSYRAPFRAVCIEKKPQFRHMLWTVLCGMWPSCLSFTHMIRIGWIGCRRLFNLKFTESFWLPRKKNKCYKRHLGFMRQSASRFIGYRMFTDVPQLLKVHSLTFKSSSNHVHRLRSTFPHRCSKSTTKPPRSIWLMSSALTLLLCSFSADKAIRAPVSVHNGGSDFDIWQKLNLIKSSTTSAANLCFISRAWWTPIVSGVRYV